ncbi:hypothetical protein ABPG72_004795 [Tetrahymena utriculariae]
MQLEKCLLQNMIKIQKKLLQTTIKSIRDGKVFNKKFYEKPKSIFLEEDSIVGQIKNYQYQKIFQDTQKNKKKFFKVRFNILYFAIERRIFKQFTNKSLNQELVIRKVKKNIYNRKL